MSILSQQKQSQAPDFPNVRPSLDLRFALAKKLDPRITFTRGSTGTYFGPDGIMKTAGVNEPRFDHDPITGQSLGLLIEESRQNIALQSESINSSPWGTSTLTFATDSIVAPDGNTTADKLIENPSFSSFKTTAQSVGTISGTYTVSAFFKAGERYRGYIQLFGTGGNATAIFNLRTGTITGGSGTNTITPYPNGWYRVSSTQTFTSATASIYIVVQNDSGTSAYTGDGTSGIYIWGAQLEAGAFPTSYIPTTVSTVTRSADAANITNISSFFNASEGTLCVDSEMPYQTNLKFPFIGFTRGAGATNSIGFYYYNTSTPYAAFLVRNTADAAGGGTVAANLVEASGPSQTVGVYKKFIGTYKFGEFNYYFDGKYVNRRTTNKNLPSNLTYMEIGTNAGSSDRLNGHIRRITYYPIQLTNQQLINLSS